jgi:hypothetical protein
VAREFAARLNHLSAHPATDRRAESRPWGGQERFDEALIDAKELVTGAPAILLEQVPAPEAEAARERLEGVGATVELL